MEAIDPTKIEDLEEAQKLITTLQNRLYKAENYLDDLSRSVEIAQFTKQYQVTEVFVNESQEFLKDRITIPLEDHCEMNLSVIEGEISKETLEGLKDKFSKPADA